MKRTGFLFRIIPVLLAAVLLVGALPAAAAEPEAQPAVELTAAREGGQINVKIKTLSQIGIDGMTFSFDYDSSAFVFSEVVSDWFGDPAVNESEKLVMLTSGNSETFPAGTVLAELRFSAGDAYVMGNEYTFTVTFSEVVDADLNGYDWQTAAISAVLKEELAPEGMTAVMRTVSASLEGRILLNFYLLLSDDVLADEGAYVLFTGGETDLRIPVSEAPVSVKAGETRYQFIYPTVAKEIRDNVNFRIYDGNDRPITLTNLAGTNDYTQTGVTYSLIRYCTKALETDDPELKTLLEATIDYCTAAQIALNYKAEGLSVSGAVAAVTAEDLAPYKSVTEGTQPAGVTRRSISALVESDNSLRVYFYFDGSHSAGDYVCTVDGTAVSLEGVTPVQEGNSAWSAYLQIANVVSNKLGETHTLTISAGTNTLTLKCSVLTYARASANSADEALQNMGKAMYLYGTAAKAYFG